MFGCDLDELDTADLLAAAAEFAQTQEHAAVRILQAALAYADRHATIPRIADDAPPGTERVRGYGGEGCPGVAEFAIIEFGAVLGMSTGAAGALIGEALALRHRLPRVWAAVLNGDAIAWRAREIARACACLSLDACAIVDARVAGIVNTLTPAKLTQITTAAIWQADPELAQARAEAAARTRGVFVAQSDARDDHGTKRIWVRAAAGDVIRFDATIDDLARALHALGDTDTHDQRRAKAIGWIADPAAAHKLIQVARHLAATRPQTRASTRPGTTSTRPTSNGSTATGAAGASTGAPPTQIRPTGTGSTQTPPTGGDSVGTKSTGTSPTSNCTRSPLPDDAAAPDDTATPPAPDPASAADATNAADCPVGQDHMLSSQETPNSDDAQPENTSERPAGPGTTPGDEPHSTHDHEPHARLRDAPAGDPGDDPWEEPPDERDRRPGDDPWDGYLSEHGDVPWEEPDGERGEHADVRGGARGEARGGWSGDEGGGDGFTWLALAGSLEARLAAIKQDAYRSGLGAGSGMRRRHTLYVHLTDHTLATGTGVLRVEELGPQLATQLTELLGHDQIVVKPVIDLHDQVSVHAYEIPDRIRERVRLRHPVDMFPYGTAETTPSTDLDHIAPYRHTTNPPDPPEQTSVDNLIPQSRLHHRAKTFGGWRNKRLPNGAIEWTSPHGFRFHVDHTGTHRLPRHRTTSHKPRPHPNA